MANSVEKIHKHIHRHSHSHEHRRLDQLGMFLSLLCTIHCVATPLVVLSLPIIARYYLLHPYFHVLLALIILPVGMFAFYSGYKNHRKKNVYLLGIPGLLIVAVGPLILHKLALVMWEPLIMIVGSSLLVWAHFINYKECRVCRH